MTDKERKERINESASNYMRGRAMALSFKPLTLEDVRDAYKSGAADMEQLIDNSMWWKSASGDELPEIDREVIALTVKGQVVFAHRPDPNGFDAKSLDTGKIEHMTPVTYDEGGWNIPDILYWLDIQIPKIN